MSELSQSLGEFARRKLSERGVEVHVNTSIESASAGTVTAGGLGKIVTHNLVWTAGVAPTPFIQTLGIPLEKGRIPTDQCFRVAGLDGVWAIGDVARIPDGRGGFQPSTAQHALREGRHLAENIVALTEGELAKPFRYRTMGMLATVGHRAGVGEVFWFHVSGFPAWWMWRTYYLFRLPRIEKRLHVMLDWTLDLLFPRDIVQLIMGAPGEAVGVERSPE